MNIKVEFSISSLFGKADPVKAGYDEAASANEFSNQVYAKLAELYPTDSVSVVASGNDRVTVNGLTDHEEADWINQVIGEIWEAWNWLVKKS